MISDKRGSPSFLLGRNELRTLEWHADRITGNLPVKCPTRRQDQVVLAERTTTTKKDLPDGPKTDDGWSQTHQMVTTHPMTMDHTIHRVLEIAPARETRPTRGRAEGADRAIALVEVARIGEIPLTTHLTPLIQTPGAGDLDDLLIPPDVTDATNDRRVALDPRDREDTPVECRTPNP